MPRRVSRQARRTPHRKPIGYDGVAKSGAVTRSGDIGQSGGPADLGSPHRHGALRASLPAPGASGPARPQDPGDEGRVAILSVSKFAYQSVARWTFEEASPPRPKHLVRSPRLSLFLHQAGSVEF